MKKLKEDFDDFIKEYGHKVLIAHSENKIHCDCWNSTTNEGYADCPDCFGTGWHYKWYQSLARRAEENITLESGKLSLSQDIKIHSIGYKFYFKTEVPIFSNDLIFEISDSSARNKVSKFIVNNHDVKSTKNDSYQIVLANKISSNNKNIDKKIRKILKKDIKVM